MGAAMVDKTHSSRRSFLSKLWITLGLAALLQVLTGAVFFLFTGRKRPDKRIAQFLQIGVITDFAPGSVNTHRQRPFLSCPT